MRRLFVPLTTAAYEDFCDQGKRWEVRALGRQYTPSQLVSGRAVELRKGYSGESLWGVIGQVRVGALEDVLASLPLKEVEPRAASLEEAIAENRAMLGRKERYIAFEVL